MSLPVVTIKPRRALPFFSRHPWVYEGAIQSGAGSLEAGQSVEVRASTGEFLGYGLANPRSKIRVRLYSWDQGQPLDEAFWQLKIDQSIALRKRLSLDRSSCGMPVNCRLVFSEADGLSGLTVDSYGEYLLLQWTSAALAEHSKLILPHLIQTLQPRGIWLRTEKGMREAEGMQLRDGLLHGESPPSPLFVSENGLRFAVDVVEGHKTGYYFDQRENRRTAAKYCTDRRVLDLFCYTGGFGITAASLGGAAEVTCVDSSAAALKLARQNAELNGCQDRITFEESDIFRKLESLRSTGEKFDIVILDPPKMARTQGGIRRALRGYHSLNKLALEVLSPDGLLVSCSCSGLVDRGTFQEMLSKAALDAGRILQVLESRGAAADHPVNLHCLDNAYLKCFLCRALKP